MNYKANLNKLCRQTIIDMWKLNKKMSDHIGVAVEIF